MLQDGERGRERERDEPSLDDLSLRSEVIISMKFLSSEREREREREYEREARLPAPINQLGVCI